MVKRILLILLFLITIGVGGFFVYKYYGEAKDYKTQLETVQGQLSAANAQIAEIGSMGEVYQTVIDVKSGDEIKETDLISVSVPESTIHDEQRITLEDVVGRKFRLNLKAGATMSTDMLMTDEESAADTLYKYPRELTFDALPVTLEVGDYVDIRFFLANGEEYVVLDHSIIRRISDNTITLYVTEDENILINSMFTDLGAYNGVCTAYLYKYIEPGNAETVPFYPVSGEIAQFIKFNPNVNDITRLENTNMRAHLDEVLVMLSNNNNSGIASSIMSIFSTQISMQNSARQNWINAKEQAEQSGEQFTDTDGISGGESSSGDSYTVAEPVDTESEGVTGGEEVDPEEIQ